MNTRFLLTFSLVAGLAAALPTATFAKAKAGATPSATPSATATPAAKPDATPRAVPYHGKVTAVDAAAKTFSIHGKEKDRVFAITEETVIIGKDGNPATLTTIPVGEEVRGSALKNGDNWTAKKVTIGAKEGATPAKGKAGATPAVSTPAKAADAKKST